MLTDSLAGCSPVWSSILGHTKTEVNMIHKKIFRWIAIAYAVLAVLAFTLPTVLEFLNALVNCWNWRSAFSLYRCM